MTAGRDFLLVNCSFESGACGELHAAKSCLEELFKLGVGVLDRKPFGPLALAAPKVRIHDVHWSEGGLRLAVRGSLPGTEIKRLEHLLIFSHSNACSKNLTYWPSPSASYRSIYGPKAPVLIELNESKYWPVMMEMQFFLSSCFTVMALLAGFLI